MFAHTVCSIWPIDRTISGATTPGQSRPESNGNERVLHIPQISKAGVMPSDDLMPYPGHTLREGSYHFCRDAVGVLYSPSWVGFFFQGVPMMLNDKYT